MDDSWIGRKLRQASPALRARFTTLRSGAHAVAVLEPIVEELLYQVGCLVLSEGHDVAAPFARTRGILRVSRDSRPQDIAVAFNLLAALTSEYLSNLPGITHSIERKARDAIRHAGATTLRLQTALLHGEPDPSLRAAFGGAVVLAFDSPRARPNPMAIRLAGA
jgi:hypothetical protein